MIELQRQEGDDAGYLLTVASLLTALKETIAVKEVYLIKIDNWFGSKWLTFSGKALGAVSIWNHKVTLPPFVPNRVLEELHVQLIAGSENIASRPITRIHKSISSSEALNRKLATEYEGMSFIWYSGKTERNKKGSVMVYLADKGYWCWWVELSERKNWEPVMLKGISREQYSNIMGR